MPFDTELAIAAMPQNNGQHPEELLRGRYPELAFLFDEMADLRYLVEGHDAAIDAAVLPEQERSERLLDLAEEAEKRLIQVAAALNDVLLKPPHTALKADVRHVAAAAMTASEYVSKRRVAEG
jgi:hypothetical protein